MLATLLAQPLDTAAARADAWRQAVDILAQRRGGEAADLAYDFLRGTRDEVPGAVRSQAARALAGNAAPVELVALLADDVPAVASAALGEVRLDPAEWLALLPRLGPTGRGIVRNRRDLAPGVLRALAAFGSVDLVFAGPDASGENETPAQPATPAEAPAPEPPPRPAELPLEPPAGPLAGTIPISELVARIAAFKTRGADAAAPSPSPPLEGFRFETLPDGTISWTDGVPRGALIGASIALAADAGGAGEGVDGHAAGAFRRRAPFRDARLLIAGEGAVAGAWRISAVPTFDPLDGRFTGYRGAARRPRADETSASSPQEERGLFGTGMPPDSLRQLVHELRTPINAILGFAEMIEAQLLGPVGVDYRLRAAEIASDGRRLLAAVDDLDVAARIESRRWLVEGGAVDASALLARLHTDYEAIARDRGVGLAVRIAAALPPIDADAIAVERMFARMLAATIGLAQRGEAITVQLGADSGTVDLEIARPALVRASDERTLLDPGYSPDGDWPDAPLLGLGFALRLVRNLATAAGGELAVEPERFRLRLPARGDSARSGQSSH